MSHRVDVDDIGDDGHHGEKREIDVMEFENVIAKKVEIDRSETVAMNERW